MVLDFIVALISCLMVELSSSMTMISCNALFHNYNFEVSGLRFHVSISFMYFLDLLLMVSCETQ